MCFGAEAAWIPLVASAAGAGMSGIAQHQMLKKQDQATAQNIMQQAARNREASARVGKNVQQLQQSNPDSHIAARRTAYTDALRRAQPTNAALPGTPGASARFAEDVGSARVASAASGAEDADLLARIEAPTLQRQQEAQAAAGTSSDLNLIADRSRGEDFLAKMRLASIRPNALLTAGGQLLSGFGQAAAARGGTGGGSIWEDGTASSGLTAQQRRMKWLGTPGIGDMVH